MRQENPLRPRWKMATSQQLISDRELRRLGLRRVTEFQKNGKHRELGPLKSTGKLLVLIWNGPFQLLSRLGCLRRLK